MQFEKGRPRIGHSAKQFGAGRAPGPKLDQERGLPTAVQNSSDMQGQRQAGHQCHG